MKLAPLAATLAALLCAATTVGCSEPDVAGFQGSKAHPSAGDDDDDDDVSAKTTKTTKTTNDTPTDTTSATPAPASTTPAPTSTPPAPTTTPASPDASQACFTRCVSPVPEAAAFDACSLKCATNDTACVDDCYASSNCGGSALCDTALSQCDAKCPPTH